MQSTKRNKLLVASPTPPASEEAILYMRLSELRNWDENYHRGNVDRVVASLIEFGFRGALRVWQSNIIIAGNTTLKALNIIKAQGLAKPAGPIRLDLDSGDWLIPCIDCRDFTRARATAFAVADNNLAKLGEDDETQLAALLKMVESEDASLLPATGYDEEQLRALFEATTEAEEQEEGDAGPDVDSGEEANKADELQAKWQVKVGDLWRIGAHRLLCGDSTVASDVARLFGEGDPPTLMVTDPPYGVNYDADWRNEAFGDADRATGVVSNDDSASWQAAWELSKAEVVYCWHGYLHASIVEADLKAAGFELRSQIIWSKAHFVVGRGHYHNRHEPCWYAVRKGATANWIGAANEQTIWTFGLDERAEGGHSTQKPLECMLRPIRNHKAPVVYDPFIGTGTTLVACEVAHRQGRGIELEPRYCAVTLERLSKLGLKPTKE